MPRKEALLRSPGGGTTEPRRRYDGAQRVCVSPGRLRCMELVVQVLAVDPGHYLLHGPVLWGLSHNMDVSLTTTHHRSFHYTVKVKVKAGSLHLSHPLN